MTGYMKEMRKLVGHRTIIQCAASIICVDTDNNILLGRRSDNHMLGYTGGSVEIDEHVEDCARRELFEEMGIVAKKLEFLELNELEFVGMIYGIKKTKFKRCICRMGIHFKFARR